MPRLRTQLSTPKVGLGMATAEFSAGLVAVFGVCRVADKVIMAVTGASAAPLLGARFRQGRLRYSGSGR